MEHTEEQGLEAAILAWKGQHAKYQQLFAPAVLESDGYKKERLRQLNMIALRFGKAGLDDPSTLRLLALQRKGIEQGLRIGTFTKWWQRIGDYFRARREVKLSDQQERLRSASAKEALFQSGFGRYADHAREQMKAGKAFSIHYSEPLGLHQRMDYRLAFKPGTDGRVAYSGYYARFIDRRARVSREQFYPNNREIMPASIARVLLSGHARVDPLSMGREREYMQYDFNDRDAEGNYRLVRFSADRYEQEAVRSLRSLPHKEALDEQATESLLLRMGEGQAVPVNLVIGRKEVITSIQANPKTWNILVLDKEGKVLDPYQERTERKKQVKEQSQLREKARNRKSLAQ